MRGVALEGMSRRQALGRAAGAAALAGGAGLGGAAAARAQGAEDPQILTALLDVQRLVGLAAGTLAAGGGLSPGAVGRIRTIAAQEEAHAALLAFSLTEIGGRLPRPPDGPQALTAILPGLDAARGEAAAQDYLLRLTGIAVYGLYLAVVRLYDQKLVQRAVGILGNEAQHLVVLRTALGRPVPVVALETGRSA